MSGRAANGRSSVYEGWTHGCGTKNPDGVWPCNQGGTKACPERVSDGWHGRVTMGRKPNGAIDRRHVRGKTRSEVTRKVRELEKQRDSGEYAQVHHIRTVEQWLTHWVETHAVRAKSRAAYRTAVYKHLIPGLGQHTLKTLNTATIEAFYARMYETRRPDEAGVLVRVYRPATVHQVHRTLRTALGEAVRQRYLGINPAEGARVPTDQAAAAGDTEVTPFTTQEASALLEATRNTRGGVRFILALSYGLRQGECLGLKWENVSLEGEQALISVRQQLQRHTWEHGCGTRGTDNTWPCGRKRGCDCPKGHGGGLHQVAVKSRAGRRDIRIDPELTASLREHKRKQAEERLAAGSEWSDTGYVFTQLKGKPLDPRKDYEAWRQLLAKAGLREARLHDARHTAATILLVVGVDPRTVMSLMGWSSNAMLQRYQHVIDDLRSDAATRVGNWMYGDGQDNRGTSLERS